MSFIPKLLSEVPAVGTYQEGDALLIIRGGAYTRLNELPQGLQGEEGPPGENGESPSFRREGEFLQFKLPSDADWSNLVPLADIKGDSGEAIELQVTATHIQYRVVGDVDWINLIDLEALQGPQGEQGLQGATGPQGPQGDSGVGGGNSPNGLNAGEPDSWQANVIATFFSGGGWTPQLYNAFFYYLVFFLPAGQQLQLFPQDSDFNISHDNLFSTINQFSGEYFLVEADATSGVTVMIQKNANNNNVQLSVIGTPLSSGVVV